MESVRPGAGGPGEIGMKLGPAQLKRETLGVLKTMQWACQL